MQITLTRHDVKTHLSVSGSHSFINQVEERQRRKIITIKLSLQSLKATPLYHPNRKTSNTHKAYKLGINHKSSNCVGIKRLISCRDFIYILRHIRLNADKSFVVIWWNWELVVARFYGVTICIECFMCER